MKKKLLRLSICILTAASILSNTSTLVFAKHKHSYGSTHYYKTRYVGGNNPKKSEECVTAYVYDYKQCNTCGEKKIYKSYTEKMTDSFMNGKCKYCGLGYGITGYLEGQYYAQK